MQLALVLVTLLILIVIIHFIVYYEPTLDLVFTEDKKNLLLWYNKEGKYGTERHWIKLLEF